MSSLASCIEYDDTALRHMFASLLLQAINDWNRFGHITVQQLRRSISASRTSRALDVYMKDLEGLYTFGSPRDEMREFYTSDWFDMLADATEIEPEVFLQRTGAWHAASALREM